MSNQTNFENTELNCQPVAGDVFAGKPLSFSLLNKIEAFGRRYGEADIQAAGLTPSASSDLLARVHWFAQNKRFPELKS